MEQEIQENKQEYILQLSLIEQEARKIEEQIQFVNQQVLEFKNLQEALRNLEKEEEKEFLASIGKGIFLKSEIKDKNLFVNIGSGVVLKKTPQEAGKIIDRQIEQLEGIKTKLIRELEKLYIELNKIVREAEKK